MAEESVQNQGQETLTREEEVVVTDVPQAEKASTKVEKEPQSTHVRETEESVKPRTVEEEPAVENDMSTKPADNVEKIPQSVSFEEESTRVADLPETEKKALEELKQLIQDALNKHEFTTLASSLTSPSPPKEEEKPAAVEEREDEKPAEEKPSEVTADVPPMAPEEPTKPESETLEETKDGAEKKAEPENEATVAEQLTETVVVTKVIKEKVAADSVDDDGAKTVEAIEETIVAVSSSVPQEQPPTPPTKDVEGQNAAPPPEPEEKDTKAPLSQEEVSIWGVPLLADERSDVILLKFLRARDFKVKDAFSMIKNTVRWRKDFGIDKLLEEDLGSDLEKVVFMHGFDKEGHPVCYNVYGEFQSKELYQKTFSDEEKRQKFLRWRIQFLERSIRKLDFTPGGICTIVQVNDLKNSPGPGKWELRHATKQALQLLQDNYPEFVAKQVFINVPWWYLAVNRMISPFLTQRTKSKFVFAGPSKSVRTLSRYIAPEQVPIKYGGLSKDGEFGTTDAVNEITIRPAAKHTVEFPVTESCLLSWEVRVVGWEVRYGAEFVPSAEESYTVIIQKTRKVSSSEEPVVCNSFKIGEPGKVVLTIDNPTSKKKKLLYRLKTKPSSD
ncbi:patellin-3-like [Juglans microcarpa x Juglans regia]|uniref:patellin-3-like n=1 Tax=Juglans microcarpa x Juglans regia TaxID=2249226 RepID=UPI001B7D9CFA|nr:patellin-3-like [Juglans microcarpa x Juglans regia]